jgi:RNA polymerase sigma-70 factor (ECF subfamily)
MALSLETATLPGSGRHPFVQLNPEARHVEGSVPHTMPDGMLISRIATGDRLAMRLLYARHHVRVFRFVLRVARDRAMAEDLTSDVFLDVWRQAGRFEGRSAVTTWLLKIAHYKTLSALRRRPHEELTDEMAETIVDQAPTPDRTLNDKDESKALRACLCRLSANHREVIDLVYYHGKSIEEVAAIVGVKETTVRTRMFHARRQLAAMLAGMGVERG